MRAAIFLSAVLALAASPGSGVAQSSDLSAPRSRIELFDHEVYPGVHYQQYMAGVAAEFRIYDTDGKGLTAQSLSRDIRVRQARRRGLSAGQILIYDLDGDRRISREERRAAKNFAGQIASFDRDGDGVTTLAEVFAAANNSALGGTRQRDIDQLLALPEAQDGRLTSVEIAERAHATFEAADADHDFVISADEAQAWIRDHPETPVDLMTPFDFVLARPAPWDRVVLVTDFRQGPGSLHKVTLRIAPGWRPLYIVLMSTDTDWEIQGATGRVVRLNVFRRWYAQDTVSGLDAKSVREFARGWQFPFLWETGRRERLVTELSDLLHHAPARVIDASQTTVVEAS